ncbi:flavin reductase family protein [Thermoactinospora rubra]|uniref:flavin reductase family protein n=1 Tax=Thermoactinospora rubra TaxID=1088767 RepID=UPI000A0F4E5F|nr:flavin reductase family protein [Thermoactinospora rubra]
MSVRSPYCLNGIDPAGLPRERIFDLLIGSVVPRPIAWTSTVGPDGIRNLAPFSFFTVVSTVPPMVCLVIEARAGGAVKDTLRNIEATGEFVINTVSTWHAGPMYASGRAYAPEVDEFAACGVTPAPSSRVRPPRVAEAKISMECVLRMALRPGGDTMVIGEVVAFHVDPGVVDPDGRIDIGRLSPLGRVDSRFVHLGAPFRP